MDQRFPDPEEVNLVRRLVSLGEEQLPGDPTPDEADHHLLQDMLFGNPIIQPYRFVVEGMEAKRKV